MGVTTGRTGAGLQAEQLRALIGRRTGRGGGGGARRSPVPGWGAGRRRARPQASAMALPALLLPPLVLLVLLARAATPPGPGPGPAPASASADLPLPAQPPDALFAAGAEAYTRGDWPSVVLQMERALRARVAVRSRLVRCRLRCANATAGPVEGADPQLEPVLRDLLFFRGLLRRAACLRGCGPAAPSRYRLGDELDREFSKRSPYNYLQVAYFKVRDRQGEGGGSPPAAGPAATPGGEEGASRCGGIRDGRDARRDGGTGRGTERTGRGRSRSGGCPRDPGGVRLSAPVGWGVPDGGPGPCPSLRSPPR